ncbi:Ead/Ea22-like protein [Arthrobacter sp. AG1021]|uniref:ead/Ea22-like family protein n=1 Tax=Arthrobacter sp. AG1021 TaxID=2183908 RepID=UPI000EB2829A|nr:ead/Ea22-like family protein [Arthrobacter sp. AG1021]RKS19671.1 Ead/Ea22-like protein [Arthrobacter sp. AG1021]
MTINLDTLRKTAEAATPGPWDLYSTQDYEVFCAANFTDSNYDPPAVTYGSDRSEDAEFIATFNPETVLALLSRLEQAEQAVQRVREVIRQYDPDHLTCMCNSDGDCCKCTVADFQEALEGDDNG